MSTILEIAGEYIARGWKIIPIPPREKGPKLKGWQNLRITSEMLPFIGLNQNSNLGILMGEPSGLVCVDLDFEPARQLAPFFLPATGLVCGRGENPNAHWFYEIAEPLSTEKWRIPPHANVETHHTVELLSTGAQVVVGPSVHPSGDVYDVLTGEPAKVTADELKAACLALHRAVMAKLGIAEELPRPPKEKSVPFSSNVESNLRTALEEHHAEIFGAGETKDGCPGYYVRCPRESLHKTPNKTKDCMAWKGPNGGWQAKCQHASCGIDSWQSLREALNPNWVSKADQLAQVDLSVFMGQKSAEQSQDDLTDDSDDDLEEQIGTVEIDFPEECLRPPGLLQRIVDYNLATAKYPQPEHALAGALALMSLITGRRIRDAADTRTNLMIVALGPTRSGKEYPRAINKKILDICGKSKLFEEKTASHSALHNFLKEDNVGLLMHDEFGDFLALARSTKGANTQPAQIISAMIKLYSSSSSFYKADRYADNVKQVEINQPHLTLYGTSTGEVFWKHVTPEYLSGGLFGRVMIFENRGYVDARPTLGEQTPLPEDIIRDVNGWFDCFSHYDMLFWKNPEPVTVPHSSDARARFEAHELAICTKRKRETPLRAAMWSGTAEVTAKLALLFSVSRSRSPLQIEVCDVDLAIRLSNWLTRRKVELSGDNVAENQIESAAKRVMKAIKASGSRGITQHALTRRTQWLRSRERQEILMDLLNGNLISVDEIKTKTKPRKVFRINHRTGG